MFYALVFLPQVCYVNFSRILVCCAVEFRSLNRWGDFSSWNPKPYYKSHTTGSGSLLLVHFPGTAAQRAGPLVSPLPLWVSRFGVGPTSLHLEKEWYWIYKLDGIVTLWRILLWVRRKSVIYFEYSQICVSE